MKRRIPPVILIFIMMAVCLVLALMTLGLAVNQRYLGLQLTPAPRMSPPMPAEGVLIDRVVPGSPAAALPALRSAPRTAVLVGLADASGTTLTLSAADLIEEPDVLDSYAAMRSFYARQEALARLLRQGPVTLVVQVAADSRSFTLEPADRRALRSLPLVFWLQIAVGLGGAGIGVWVWGLRRGAWATRCLALSGVGLMVSAFAAAVYSTRELAIPGDVFLALSALNHFGAFAFGVGMIGLFMVYPRRLFHARWLAVPALGLGAWFAAAQMGMIATPAIGIHLGVILALLTIVAMVTLQFRATRGDPRDRAALSWLGLAVLVGSGAFVATVITPHLLGMEALVSQGAAFVFFLLIYVGVALGVARFQLFQMETWAFRILFYMGGVLLLLTIDAVLIFTIVDERAPAFALSLLIVALIWLPLRDTLARRLLRRRAPVRSARLRSIMDVALAQPGRDQQTRWETLLRETFRPLGLTQGQDTGAARLAEDGLVLALPRIGALPALDMRHADSGHRLFSPRDLELAQEMAAMLQQAMESHAAYEKGVTEERSRIARDIHDNIGVQLLAALHSPQRERKDLMIRETLTDLRDIINNAANPDMSLDEMLADLRAQIAEQLFIAGAALDWLADNPQGVALPLQTVHTLRSIIREGVQNALKHAAPARVAITVRVTDGRIHVSVADDGKGFDPAHVTYGNGLANLSERAQAMGGDMRIRTGPAGTNVTADIPLGDQARRAS